MNNDNYRSMATVSVSGAFLLALLAFSTPARAILNGFEFADGYAGPFVADVWSYDAGQTGASFLPSQYNTGRWVELLGSSSTGDAQYGSQHGTSSAGANSPPFALAIRAVSETSPSSFDMSLQYAVGSDDIGIAPTTPLLSATIDFDICPGLTVLSTGGLDTMFNDVPAFSFSVGGTDSAPGLTIGFSDHDPGNTNKAELFHIDGATYNSQPVNWTFARFDHIQLVIDFVNQQYDLFWTKDANGTTTEFDAGNTPVLIASNVAMSNAVSTMDSFYFRAHTDPSTIDNSFAGLEKSYVDNFQFSVTPVPEPASAGLLALAAGAVFTCTPRKRSL